METEVLLYRLVELLIGNRRSVSVSHADSGGERPGGGHVLAARPVDGRDDGPLGEDVVDEERGFPAVLAQAGAEVCQ